MYLSFRSFQAVITSSTPLRMAVYMYMCIVTRITRARAWLRLRGSCIRCNNQRWLNSEMYFRASGFNRVKLVMGLREAEKSVDDVKLHLEDVIGI